jgi:hypothetical protein
MTGTTQDSVAVPDLVAAAREVIRREGHAQIVSLWQLLDDLGEQFGDRFPVSDDTKNVLELIERLWEEPHIDQPTSSIEFAWNDRGRGARGSAAAFKAMLIREARALSADEQTETSATRDSLGVGDDNH